MPTDVIADDAGRQEHTLRLIPLLKDNDLRNHENFGPMCDTYCATAPSGKPVISAGVLSQPGNGAASDGDMVS